MNWPKQLFSFYMLDILAVLRSCIEIKRVIMSKTLHIQKRNEKHMINE